ncbi:MAG: hypothetical protein ACXVCY_00110 [Pseudobdellovibrionaceae bacterium]
MRKHFYQSVALLFFLTAQVTASAAEIHVTVPKSQVVFEKMKDEAVPKNYFIELQSSSWNPNVSEPSRLNETNDFSSNGNYAMTFLFGKDTSSYEGIDFSNKLGLSYLQMSRSGKFKFGSSTVSASQNLNIYQVEASIQGTGAEVLKNVRPFFSLSLAPTSVQSVTSEFNNGVSEWYWLGKTRLGVVASVPLLASLTGLDKVAFEIGGEYSQNIFGTDLSGAGLFAGTRFDWK